jgi:hypothetical protein
MSIEIKKIALHHLDVNTSKVESVDLNINIDVIEDYVNGLITEILESPNKRSFKFKDGNTEVKSSLPQLVSNDIDIDNTLLNNAKRLLEKEVEVDEKIKKLGVRVQRGSLIHIHFNENGNDNVLICKIEHDEIINEKTFEINKGLNTKRKVFKAFLIYMKTSSRKEEIYLNDKNNSKYWWDYFLELKQLKTDEENTEKSLDKIVSIITNTARRDDFKLDGTILRNHVIGYYRNNTSFNFTDLYDSIFKEYNPFNKDFPISKISSKISDLKRDNDFDKQFTIIPNKIGKKRKNSIKILPGLFLNIEDHVKNLDTILKPYSEAGDNGITIISDLAYKYIKNVNRDN